MLAQNLAALGRTTGTDQHGARGPARI